MVRSGRRSRSLAASKYRRAESRKLIDVPGTGVSASQPLIHLTKASTGPSSKTPAGGSSKQRRRHEGNRERASHDLRRLHRSKRPARDTQVDLIPCEPVREGPRLLYSTGGQRGPMRRRVGTYESLDVVCALGVPSHDEAFHLAAKGHTSRARAARRQRCRFRRKRLPAPRAHSTSLRTRRTLPSAHGANVRGAQLTRLSSALNPHATSPIGTRARVGRKKRAKIHCPALKGFCHFPRAGLGSQWPLRVPRRCVFVTYRKCAATSDRVESLRLRCARGWRGRRSAGTTR